VKTDLLKIHGKRIHHPGLKRDVGKFAGNILTGICEQTAADLEYGVLVNRRYLFQPVALPG
jgi:hypothetical protein